MVRKARKYTSRRVPTEKERKAAEAEGSRFLTEAEKDEIEADMAGGESKLMQEANKAVGKKKNK